jgi:hypothetical protein
MNEEDHKQEINTYCENIKIKLIKSNFKKHIFYLLSAKSISFKSKTLLYSYHLKVVMIVKVVKGNSQISMQTKTAAVSIHLLVLQ